MAADETDNRAPVPPPAEVVDLAAARKRASAAQPGASRQAKKQAARAEKARKAAANRVRFGRSKAEKAKDRHTGDKAARNLDGMRRLPDTTSDES